jgi:hypothetical protein
MEIIPRPRLISEKRFAVHTKSKCRLRLRRGSPAHFVSRSSLECCRVPTKKFKLCNLNKIIAECKDMFNKLCGLCGDIQKNRLQYFC